MSISELIDKKELKFCVNLINKHKIPPSPKTLLELKRETSLKNPDAKLIIDLINKDIGLSSSILRVINSAQFNLSENVVSIEHAIRLLGINKIKSAIIEPAYKFSLSQNMKDFDYIAQHSHDVGLIAKIISKYVVFDRVWEPDSFYLAGLFHDVGVIVMSFEYPNYKDFYTDNKLRPLSILTLEKEEYKVTHSAIGVLLAKKWGLPNEICNAIYVHHHIYNNYKDKISHESLTMSEILKLAHALNNAVELGVDESNQEQFLMYTNSVKELLLDDEQMELIKQDVHDL